MDRWKQLKRLLDGDTNEESVHSFLYENAELLGSLGLGTKRVFSKPELGNNFKADFAIVGWGNYEIWTFVEIEKPSDRLFNKDNTIARSLNKALGQVNDWWCWLDEFKDYARESFYDFGGDKYATIVLGRRRDLTNAQQKLLKQMNSLNLGGRLRILTYDALLDFAHDPEVKPNPSLTTFKTIKDWRKFQEEERQRK